ncbi:ChbG/HpnK family deacetylase [Pseudomonas sp. B392_1p]|uniref:ChbG/HpnK family deacetylase n=1 Tax=Pseudomonas sp. B392_1p TaxID=3457507 RepID=UPI003FD24E42
MIARVIINADDFGLSSEENHTIISAFAQNLISSATLMANMPGFVEACELTRQHRLQGKIGLHFNLTYGRPLSQPIQAERRVCSPSGDFDLQFRQHQLWLPRRTRQAIEEELRSQWQRCLEHGVRPSHIDSHQHVHNIWPIGEVVARFARRQGVPLRLARNLGRNLTLPKRVYKRLLNWRLRTLGHASADHVCTPLDLHHGALPSGGILEVIAHPSRLDDDFGDAYLEQNQSLTELLARRLANVPRIAYSALPGVVQ